MTIKVGLFENNEQTTMPPSLTALNPDNNTSQKKWKNLLKEETESEYFLKLKSFIKEQRSKGKIIYPQDSEILNALHFTPLENVKVVILGQDPYHGPGQAHGLCFSVQAGVPAPPSLVNIFLEIKNDLGISTPNHGHLVSWATQGVLLLNAVLSVENGKPGSHANMGWEKFTDKIVSIVNDNCEGVVFLLWGSYAQKKGGIINRKKHHVFTAPHPSPLSSYRGFFGCKHFSETNRILKNHGKTEINWQLHSYPNK